MIVVSLLLYPFPAFATFVICGTPGFSSLLSQIKAFKKIVFLSF